MTNPPSLSAFAKPLISVAQAAWPYLRRMYRERQAGQMPFGIGNDLLEQGVDATFDRLRGGNIDDTWWHNLLNHIGQQFVTPDFLRMPALQEWLADEHVQSDFKALAQDRIMGANTNDSGAWIRLRRAYAAMTGEDERLADGPIEVVIAILAAGYLGSIAPPLQPIAGMIQASTQENREQFDAVRSILNELGPDRYVVAAHSERAERELSLLRKQRLLTPEPHGLQAHHATPPAPGLWARGRAWLAATLFARAHTRSYLRTLMAQHREFSFHVRANPLQLERIYVSLKVGEYRPRDWLPDEPRTPLGVGSTMEVPEALRLCRRLVVLGDPGSGKTTLLKYLALQCAQRDPGLASFARSLIPTPMTRILEPLCRFLSGTNVWVPGVLSILLALIVWGVQVFRSPMPGTALAVGLLFFVSLLLLPIKSSRSVPTFGALLALALLVYAGWWQPHVVAPVAVWLMGISVVIWLFPAWVQPPLAAMLRGLLQRCTRYPLPVYLTLNHLARDTQPIEEHLYAAMSEAGFPHPHRLVARKLARGECLLLLDALDEVVDARAYQRVVKEVNRLRATYGEGNWIIVTSRIPGPGFQSALDGYRQWEVQEFDQAQIDRFVRSWFADTADPDERGRRIDGLLRELECSPRMRLLASNPLLLAFMTLLYEYNWRLPQRRMELYEECVKLLIAEWDRLRDVTRAPRFPAAHTQRVLTQLAAQFHAAGKSVFEHEDLLKALAEVLSDCGGDNADPQVFLDEIMTYTGLLRQKSRFSYDFVHLTFQEFFTACAWHERRDGEALLAHVGDAWWHQVIRLYAGLEQDATVLLARLRSHDLFLAAGCLADCRPVDTPAFHGVTETIIGALQDLVRNDAAQRQDAADALAEIADWGATTFLTDAVEQDASPPALALSALLALARAADKSVLDDLCADVGRTLRLLHGQLPLVAPPLRPRLLSLLESLGHPLVSVPAGEFLMGSDSGAANERPRHRVILGDYWIDKFPVTNEQFAQFVRATDYEPEGNWQSAFTSGKEQHPVVFVTWDDACAYGQWCGKRLPTEAEWEKAARGTDGCEYPWGNQWDGNKCNASRRGTTPVGAYPEGVSPYGCHDMAGNVWEWCQDWYDSEGIEHHIGHFLRRIPCQYIKAIDVEGAILSMVSSLSYPLSVLRYALRRQSRGGRHHDRSYSEYYQHSPSHDPQGPSSGSHRVRRGGSWGNPAALCRSANRGSGVPNFRGVGLGFRLLRSAS